MPRTAPTETVEHRFTLGTFERQELAEVLQTYKDQELVDTVIKGGLAVAAGVTAYSLFTVGQSLGHWLWEGAPTVIKDAKSFGNWFIFGDDDKFFFWDKKDIFG